MNKRYFKTIIIGAGQAGLSAGYHLQKLKEDFVIMDAAKEIGHSWRTRWDSLKLFTPAWANGLPGMSFTRIKHKFPGKDEMAFFLEQYATRFDLPVQLDRRIDSVTKSATGFTVLSGDQEYTCTNVVVATGNYSAPHIPDTTWEFDPHIRQMHSSEYRNPAQLSPGPVLVVGAATSGLQIALEIARSGRKTYVSGNPPDKIPDLAYKYLSRLFIWVMRNVLTVRTKAGRKAAFRIKAEGKAAPLVNISLEEVVRAGAVHLPRLVSVRQGYPVFTGGDLRIGYVSPVEGALLLHVATIIWCTGYNRNFSWLRMDNIVDSNGYPLAYRGVSDHHTGLYFVGMAFQYSLASTMIGGMGRDARHIAEHIHRGRP